MKKFICLFLAVLLLTLTACTVGADTSETTQIPETTVMETTQPPTDVPTEVPTEATAPSTEEFQLPEPVYSAVQPGYYLISSVGQNGDITFYSELTAENGYLKIRDDGTGFLSFEGTEGELTWDGEYLYWQNQTLPYIYMSYYDSELGRDDALLAVYFTEPAVVSLALRPAEEPAEST